MYYAKITNKEKELYRADKELSYMHEFWSKEHLLKNIVNDTEEIKNLIQYYNVNCIYKGGEQYSVLEIASPMILLTTMFVTAKCCDDWWNSMSTKSLIAINVVNIPLALFSAYKTLELIIRENREGNKKYKCRKSLWRFEEKLNYIKRKHRKNIILETTKIKKLNATIDGIENMNINEKENILKNCKIELENYFDAKVIEKRIQKKEVYEKLKYLSARKF